MDIKTINDLLSYVETEEKAQRLINYINTLENYVKMKEKDIKEFSKENYFNKLEIERLNNIINELEKYLIEDNYKNEDVWCITTQEVLNKLQELKGSNKE